MNPNFEEMKQPMKKEKEINLKEIFLVIKRRIWILAVITLLTTIFSAYFTYTNTTPLYQSSARIILGATADQMNTLKVIIKDPAVLEKVAERMELNRSGAALSSQISVGNIDGSQVVSITVTDSDPELAAKIANTTIEVYKEEVAKIMNFTNIKLLAAAYENPYPINIEHKRNIMIGVIAGIVMAIGLIFLLDSLDDSFRSEQEIEELLGAPVLGSVSRMTKKNTTKGKNNQQIKAYRGETIGS